MITISTSRLPMLKSFSSSSSTPSPLSNTVNDISLNKIKMKAGKSTGFLTLNSVDKNDKKSSQIDNIINKVAAFVLEPKEPNRSVIFTNPRNRKISVLKSSISSTCSTISMASDASSIEVSLDSINEYVGNISSSNSRKLSHTDMWGDRFSNTSGEATNEVSSTIRKLGMAVSNKPGVVLRMGGTIVQPGGMLFECLAFGFAAGISGYQLRRQVSMYISTSADQLLEGTQLSDWIIATSPLHNNKRGVVLQEGRHNICADYATNLKKGIILSSSGHIEMAIISVLKECNIHVYTEDKASASYKRVMAFDYDGGIVAASEVKTIRILEEGNNCYSLLISI